MKKVLIVNANYYKEISKNLIISAKKVFRKKKVKIFLIDTPGVFEVPFVLQKNIKKFDAFIALGCVIKGETPHFDLICNTTFDRIMNISVSNKKPIGNGIITALNMSQAKKRSSLSMQNLKPNKGKEAAEAVISLFENEPKKI